MKALIGYTGFVGSNLAKQIKFDQIFNSSNIEDITKNNWSELIFCGLPSTKWLINKNPEPDRLNIENIKKILVKTVAEHITLISTVDVYSDTSTPQNENIWPQGYNHAYGDHRLDFEKFIISHFNCSILRLPALFGEGLKKNVLYDLLNNHCLDMVAKNTSYQWYDLEDLSADIDLFKQFKVVNLVTEPIKTEIIIKLCKHDSIKFPEGNQITYDLRTKYTRTGYLHDSNVVLVKLTNFINKYLT
jgi:hypothetical protein